jgi:hypothetical protein
LRPLLCATAVMIICLGTAAWAASDKDVTVNSDSLQIQDKTGDIQFPKRVISNSRVKSRFVWVMLF